MPKVSSQGSKSEKYYPICLNLDKRKVMVIGGGAVAERKIFSLLDRGAELTVISPSLTTSLMAISKKGVIRHLDRGYEKGDLKGAFLAIVATEDKKTNRMIAKDAELNCCLVNVVDDPEAGNFIVPSTVERGRLIIAISTSGASPALSKKIRERLERIYGDEYRRFLEMMERLRKRVLRDVREERKRKEIFQALVDSDIIKIIKEKGVREAEKEAMRIIRFYIERTLGK